MESSRRFVGPMFCAPKALYDQEVYGQIYSCVYELVVSRDWQKSDTIIP